MNITIFEKIFVWVIGLACLSFIISQIYELITDLIEARICKKQKQLEEQCYYILNNMIYVNTSEYKTFADNITRFANILNIPIGTITSKIVKEITDGQQEEIDELYSSLKQLQNKKENRNGVRLHGPELIQTVLC